ncbi:MAG TPA: TIGR03435 family protein [Vicinamibacterales bacterium]|nr:TIGR03435 family protein [Vicinamibacterales bacterium]
MRHLPLFVSGIAALAVSIPTDGQVRLPPEPRGADVSGAAFDSVVVRENRDRSESNPLSRATIDDAGRFIAVRVNVLQLIIAAYSTRVDRIVGYPDWARHDLFDISALAPERFNPGSSRGMLRALLRDHFRIVAKKEKRTVPAYALEREERNQPLGRALQPAAEKCDQRDVASKPRAGVPPRGGCEGASGTGISTIFTRRAPIGALIVFLQMAVGRPVVDRTGLVGLYDIDLKFSPEPGSGFPFELPGVPDQGGGVSVFTAVKEQLGLMLRPVTTELEMLVIERLERPQLDRTVQ